MKSASLKLIVAASALIPLSGCATVLTPDRCERALSAAQTAQDVIAFLQARGVAPEIAAKIANAITLGQITLAAACAAVPVAPVETPGA